MAPPVNSPGPAAGRAFKTGMWGAAIGGLGTLGVLYWVGLVSEYVAGFVLVVLFPVYLLLAASVLSKWLGYDKGPTDLRPVTGEDVERESEGGPW